MTMFFKAIESQKKIREIFTADISSGEHRIAHFERMAAQAKKLFAKGISVEKIEDMLDVSEAFIRRHCAGITHGKPKD